MKIQKVELADILDAREQRVLRQKKLLSRYSQTLICFTMNIAGPIKNTDLILKAWREGLKQLQVQLHMTGFKVEHMEEYILFTGNEAFISAQASPLQVKELTVELEEQHPLGRLFDIDVLRADGSKVEREEVNSQPRTCLICGEPASVCASRRIHTVETLQKATDKKIEHFFSEKFADKIAELAIKALLYEVSITPKPGLVDRINNGAHRDMDFYTFLSSITTLAPYFRDMVQAGMQSADHSGEATFKKLQFYGKAAESAMRSSTADINTHKGAIFSIGIICGALGRLYGQQKELSSDGVFAESSNIAKAQLEQFTQDKGQACDTVGCRLFRAYGITGVRGEAAEGFPSVRKIGLPVLKKTLEENRSCDEAGYMALLYLIANVTDTNLIARSDYETQQRIRKGLDDWLKADNRISLDQVKAMDQLFIQHNLSPGGCADLLAVSWMMYFLEQELSWGKEKDNYAGRRL